MRGLKLSVVILVILMSLTGCPPPCNGECPKSVTEEAVINPDWGGETDSLATSTPNGFHLFWDLSKPMGGYIHEVKPDSQKTLQEIHRSVYQNSDLAYGISPKCMNLVSRASIGCGINLTTRASFTGTNSQIHNGIQSAIDSLKSGSIVGAAFISDLMATTGGKTPTTGPIALRKYFRSSNLKAYFNKGEIHMAILGVRPKYWGVQSGGCEAPPGNLGCWFHEADSIWIPLGKAVNRPIYILIIGRSLNKEDDSREDNPVATITDKVKQTLDKLGLDVKSENLTLGALGVKTDLVWNAPEGGSQSIVLKKHGYLCNEDRPSPLTLTAKFKEDGISVEQIDVRMPPDNLKFFDVEKADDKNRILLKLNCRSLRDRINNEKDQICDNDNGEVELAFNEAIMTLNYEGSSKEDWRGWYSLRENDSLTIGLDEFIEYLRPIRYRATVSPFPPLSCNK